MQLIKVAGILTGFLPLLANAGPMGAEDTIFKRAPVDICDRTAAAGDTCNHGPGGDQPHICGRNDPRAIASGRLRESATLGSTALATGKAPLGTLLARREKSKECNGK
ncbi:hypothetical protein SUNI508_11344 [Seiridium unicorne]|uniref:Uncharacterized protein n=1 Tax=Seiridium unicorne TaxID=138068 RepID=A0ABR2UIC4_9PEZI